MLLNLNDYSIYNFILTNYLYYYLNHSQTEIHFPIHNDFELIIYFINKFLRLMGFDSILLIIHLNFTILLLY